MMGCTCATRFDSNDPTTKSGGRKFQCLELHQRRSVAVNENSPAHIRRTAASGLIWCLSTEPKRGAGFTLIPGSGGNFMEAEYKLVTATQSALRMTVGGTTVKKCVGHEPDQQHLDACLGFGDTKTEMRHAFSFWLLSG
jgi:hypothetical protein